MALVATTVWEVRQAGNAVNGGGFNDRIPGTSVDYSQQNASQLSIINLVGSAASVTVTSVAAGFTNAMVGNIIRIRGGANFTVGFYEIVAFNAANSVNLDRIPCTGAGVNGLAEVGGAQNNFDLIDVVVVPGNTVHVKSGTYAAHPAVTITAAGTKQSPLSILGYNVARGDAPTANNRPLIEMDINSFKFGAVINIKHIRFSGSNVKLLDCTQVGAAIFLIENCKFSHTAVAGAASCIGIGQGNDALSVLDCEFSGLGPLTYGISAQFYPIFTVMNCYFHNLNLGIFVAGSEFPQICFNIFAQVNFGIYLSSSYAVIVLNSFIQTTTGVYTDATSAGTLCMNNTFSDCAAAGLDGLFKAVLYNNFFNCATPWIGGTLNPVDNNTFVNPQFVTPGSNYALQRTSGLIDRAFSMRLGV